MKSFLPDKVYEVLKWLSCIALSAIGELYEGLAADLGLPYGHTVSSVLTRIAIFIGMLIGVSTYQYRKSARTGIDAQPEDIDGKE